MNYCMHCGGKVLDMDDGGYRCKKCKGKLYRGPKACAAAFVVDDKKRVVMGLRSKEPKKGQLDCFGGFLELDETFEEGLFRELYEEGGIRQQDIKQKQYLTSVVDVYPWFPKDEHLVTNYFVVFLKPGSKLTSGDDMGKLSFNNIQDIKPKDFAWDGMRRAFKAFKIFLGAH